MPMRVLKLSHATFSEAYTMFASHHALFRSNHLAPAPLYLPWLDDEQSEHEAVIEDVLYQIRLA